jgi:hypothetical protein
MNESPRDIPGTEVPDSVKREWVDENWDKIIDNYFEQIVAYNDKINERKRREADEP